MNQRTAPVTPTTSGRVHLGTDIPEREVTLLGKWGCSMQFCGYVNGKWQSVPRPADPKHKLEPPDRWQYA